MRFPIQSTVALATIITLSQAYKPPPGGNQATGKMQFEYISTDKLVKELINPEGDVITRNIKSSPHIHKCAAKFTNGHALGRKYKKDKSQDEFTLARNSENEWILTDEHLIMDEGIILGSGFPDQLNGQHGDGW